MISLYPAIFLEFPTKLSLMKYSTFWPQTPAFTFTSLGNESVWNLDGERLQAHKLSAQVFRGLVNLFATGPEI